jgi:hypothetical protein
MDSGSAWRFTRSVARVQPVDVILAEYATTVCGLPVRRRETPAPRPGVTWSIDDAVMVEFVHAERGPSRLLVHELSLMAPLRKKLRSRHLTIDYVSTW